MRQTQKACPDIPFCTFISLFHSYILFWESLLPALFMTASQINSGMFQL